MQPRPRGPGPIPPCIPEVHFYIPEVLGPPCSLSSRARTQVEGHMPLLPAFLQSNAQANADYQQLGFEARLKLPKDHLYALGLDRGCSSRSSAPEACPNVWPPHTCP